MVTLLYTRRNLIEEAIADLFGVAQATVSQIITSLTAHRPGHRGIPDAEEAEQMTRGRMALVDGMLWPCWSWDAAPEMWAGKYKTTGRGSLKGFQGSGYVTLAKKPKDRELYLREHEYNNQVSSIRSLSSGQWHTLRHGRSYSPTAGGRYTRSSIPSTLYFFELSFR